MIDGIIFTPDDDDWAVNADAQIIAGAAYGEDSFLVIISLSGEEFYEFDNYCRLLKYQNGKWVMTELEDRVVSAVYRKEYSDLVLMSWEGQVAFLGETVIEEKIDLAGVNGRGYLHKCFSFSDGLYACGDRGQVYRRIESGKWESVDDVIYEYFDQKKSGIINTYRLSTLLHKDGGLILAAGHSDLENGVLFSEGKIGGWRLQKLQQQVGPIYSLFDYGTSNLISGYRFVLRVKESGESEFVSFADNVPSSVTFTDTILYEGSVYFAGDMALCKLQAGRVELVEGFMAERVRPHTIQVFNQQLWVFGYRETARFANSQWTYFRLPKLKMVGDP